MQYYGCFKDVMMKFCSVLLVATLMPVNSALAGGQEGAGSGYGGGDQTNIIYVLRNSGELALLNCQKFQGENCLEGQLAEYPCQSGHDLSGRCMDAIEGFRFIEENRLACVMNKKGQCEPGLNSEEEQLACSVSENPRGCFPPGLILDENTPLSKEPGGRSVTPGGFADIESLNGEG